MSVSPRKKGNWKLLKRTPWGKQASEGEKCRLRPQSEHGGRQSLAQVFQKKAKALADLELKGAHHFCGTKKGRGRNSSRL